MEGNEQTTYMENLCSCIQNSYRLRTGDFEGFIMIFWNTSIKNKNLVMSIQTHMIFFSEHKILQNWEGAVKAQNKKEAMSSV